MKKIFALLFLLLISASIASEKVTLIYFYSNTCHFCNEMSIFLDQMQKKYSHLEIEKYDVYADEDNMKKLVNMASSLGEKATAVPVVFINNKMFVGSSQPTKEKIESEILPKGFRYETLVPVILILLILFIYFIYKKQAKL